MTNTTSRQDYFLFAIMSVLITMNLANQEMYFVQYVINVVVPTVLTGFGHIFHYARLKIYIYGIHQLNIGCVFGFRATYNRIVGQNSTKGLASPISLTNILIKVFGHSAKVIWLACFSSIRLSNLYFTRTWWMLLHFVLTLLDIYISIITGTPTTSYSSTISTTPDYTTDLPYYSRQQDDKLYHWWVCHNTILNVSLCQVWNNGITSFYRLRVLTDK